MLVPAAAVLTGCSYGGIAPVESVTRTPTARAVPAAKPGAYVVRRGDTLYSIAWRYGFDYRQLAAWNGVREPYTIYPGQKLRLTRPPGTAPRPSPGRSPSVAEGAAPSSPASAGGAPKRASTPASTANTASTGAGGDTASSSRSLKNSGEVAAKSENVPVARWHWPAKGTVVTTFPRSGGKGIDIAGTLGQPIVAAADGYVVYSGSGLIGYGQLIIVKHNKRYLSAYAHNHKLLVKEGDTVTGGQRIAEMGRSGSNRALLHFEIRRDGKPIDPTRYLPQ